MQYRRLGRTGLSVSTVSFGAWAIGSAWGPVDDNESLAGLHAAVEAGVNFIDTADVYGDGRRERRETFSGVPYDTALAAVDALRPLVRAGETMTQFALRWILMWNAVSCAIPGARTAAQARENAAAADRPALSVEAMSAVRRVYDELLRALVHGSW